MTSKAAGPKASNKCQVSGHRSQNTGPSSQVSGDGSQLTAHKQKKISFLRNQAVVSLRSYVDELNCPGRTSTAAASVVSLPQTHRYLHR